MKWTRCLWAVSVTLALSWGMACATTVQTNVDTEEPSVIRSPVSDADGFGWTALFHPLSDIEDGDSQSDVLSKLRVIVGAPRGSFPGGLDLVDPELPAESETGLIYQCQLGNDICEGVRGEVDRYIGASATVDITNGIQDVGLSTFDNGEYFIQSISEGRLFDQAPDSTFNNGQQKFERKTTQFLGTHIYSDGKNFMACAPRWFSTADGMPPGRSEPRGICYTGIQNLTNFVSYNLCAAGGTSTSIERGAYCTLGVDSFILNDVVYISGVGYGFIHGAIFSVALVSPDTFPDPNDVNMYLPDSILPGSFFGNKITTGYISSNDRTQSPSDILYGSHRFDITNNYNGRVLFFPSTSAPVDSTASSLNIDGRQTAEFFGFSLETCDLTGDGFDEVVVGAPMYSILPTDTQALVAETGRFYTFFNSEGSLDTDNPVIISGTSEYVRLGFAVSCVGDLNADGHQDLAVSAPYERSSSTQNTGTVYIYYGRDTKEEFESQIPQKISADEIVESVSTLSTLRSFGFTLDGDADVDANGHADLLAGTPDERLVVVLRTLPFVNVTISIAPVNEVNLDLDESFTLEITASYTSANINGAINITFNVTEVLVEATDPRLFFTVANQEDLVGQGVFQFTAPDTNITVPIMAYTRKDISNLRNYDLQVNLVDPERSLSPVTGVEPLSDLSQYPRLRALGTTTLQVDLMDPCVDTVCDSDVVLMEFDPSTQRLVAGEIVLVSFTLVYTNQGTEEGRNLELAVRNVPTAFIADASLSEDDAGSDSCIMDTIENDVEFRNFTCDLRNRLTPNETIQATLSFTTTNTFIGTEDDFMVSVEILVDVAGNSANEQNLANNVQTILFTVDTESNIFITMAYSGEPYEYVTAPRDSSDVITTASDLGARAILRVVIDNEGPSTIQNASVTVLLPARDPDITGDNYFLYPSMITCAATTGLCESTVRCLNSESIFDPQQLDQETSTVTRRRRERSVVISRSKVNPVRPRKRFNRKKMDPELEAHLLSKRQTETIGLDCSTQPQLCLPFTCNIQMLTTQEVTIVVTSFVDERFFGSDGAFRNFTLNAVARVTVHDAQADDTSDNLVTASATIVPQTEDEQSDAFFIHYIIWPIIGSIIIFIVLVIILYFLGFFRRKRKPGEEEEVEGDFAEPAATAQPLMTEKPEGNEATTV